MNSLFRWFGGRKNFAFFIIVVSAYIQASVLPDLQVDTLMAAGVAFMGANALKEVAVNSRRRGGSSTVTVGPNENVEVTPDEDV